MKSKLFIILGPTASGKTDYGITLAKKVGGAIISADSRQVYAGMNIGTAKPKEAWSSTTHNFLTPDSVQGVDHYSLNVRTPDNPLTLSQWQSSAFKIIEHLISKDIQPILVGGTMLYIDSIVHNYNIPDVPPNQELRDGLNQKTTEELFTKLTALDPDAVDFVEPHNKQRIVRALEVISATSTPFSKFRQKQLPRYKSELIGLFPSWDAMKKRISKRIPAMMSDGLLEETKNLQDKYSANLPLLSTMNYSQSTKVLSGELSQEEAIEEMIRVNMRYARKQMSWWKNRDDIKWE